MGWWCWSYAIAVAIALAGEASPMENSREEGSRFVAMPWSRMPRYVELNAEKNVSNMLPYSRIVQREKTSAKAPEYMLMLWNWVYFRRALM